MATSEARAAPKVVADGAIAVAGASVAASALAVVVDLAVKWAMAR